MSPSEEHFVGPIPPELFLDRFMKPFGDYALPPAADFSKLRNAHTVRDISEVLVRLLCPLSLVSILTC